VPQSRTEHKSRRGRGRGSALGSRRARSTRGYELSNREESLHFSVFISHLPIPVTLSDDQPAKRETLDRLFRSEVQRWKKDTQHWSSVTRMLAHPSYIRIVGLVRLSTGDELARLLLEELESEPDHWFDALAAITGDDPVLPEHDFDEAVNAWLDWGRQKGLVSP